MPTMQFQEAKVQLDAFESNDWKNGLPLIIRSRAPGVPHQADKQFARGNRKGQAARR